MRFQIGWMVRDIPTGRMGRVYMTCKERVYVEYPTQFAHMEHGGRTPTYGHPKNLKVAYARKDASKHICRWFSRPQRPRARKEEKPPVQYAFEFTSCDSRRTSTI